MSNQFSGQIAENANLEENSDACKDNFRRREYLRKIYQRRSPKRKYFVFTMPTPSMRVVENAYKTFMVGMSNFASLSSAPLDRPCTGCWSCSRVSIASAESQD